MYQMISGYQYGIDINISKLHIRLEVLLVI